MNKKTVCITGATGVMGYETLKEFSRRLARFNLRLLVRDSKKNRKKLTPYMKLEGVSVIWGDLTNAADVANAIGDAEYVLHIGGMVSPLADHYPEQTMKVNVGAMQNIVDAVKSRKDADNVKVVYIGSVAETSNRNPPYHWGRTGDPVIAAKFDNYGLSKIKAEWILAESGLDKWVSLRQSGILHKGLIFKGSDPISFHVPLHGVLEWATVEDSARLMANLCEDGVPEDFWKGFYNIGSGAEFRLTNYDFERYLLESLRCPAPEKVFNRNWFATHNFHGEWYEDSDKLNEIIPFREGITAKAYFKRLAKSMPWWMNLTPLAPAFIIKAAMKRVAFTPKLGTLYWLSHEDCEDRIEAFFGSREEQASIGDWKTFDATPPSDQPLRLNHGYDENKPDSELSIDDMRRAAEFRGGKCISEDMTTGDLDTPLDWECAFGHKFRATPRTVLKGGHWCPECLPEPWNYDEQADHNPFFAQVWKAGRKK